MDKKYAKSGKAKAFFKRNVYFIIMGVCIIAIGAMITVAVLNDGNADVPAVSDLPQGGNETPVDVDPSTQDPSTPVDNPPAEDPTDPGDGTTDPGNAPIDDVPAPIVFSAPVADATVIKDYAMDTVVYWSTLKLYKVHNGIDFGGAEGANVTAAYAGTVSEVGYDGLNGHFVQIDHGNGLSTYYSSLSAAKVTVGETVTKETVLGAISTSATAEMSDGAHVHFSVYKDGEVVSPYDYLTLGDK